MNINRLTCICILFFLQTFSFVSAQSLPVGDALEDYYRNEQLSGNLDSSVSFTIRPILQFHQIPKKADTSFSRETQAWNAKVLYSHNEENGIKFLPVQVWQQYNTHHPYGWNDGSLIPAKGYQTLLSAGIFASYRKVSVQLRPEFLWAENKDFEQFPSDYRDFLWGRYYDYHYNIIDQPERFGSNSYSKVLWGQSSIRLNFDPVSFGISNENLWWGPGRRNSLLMSNTARGFKHLTFNTSRPVNTPVGSFEGQMIAGVLENSGFDPPEPGRMLQETMIYQPRFEGRRLLSGLVLSYQPKWLEGLFLGYARTSQSYKNDVDDLISGAPIFLPFKKFMSNDNSQRKSDQYQSVYGRWLMVKAKGEIYFEYGWNNHQYSYENIPQNAAASSAYIFGLKKLLPIKSSSTNLVEVSLEVTQLQSAGGELNKPGEAWYVDNYIRSGYTNRGEILGAGIGPGSDLQSLEVNWLNGFKKIGLQLERFVHNNDMYYYLFENIRDSRRHWVDLSIGTNFQWNYRNLLINAQLKSIKSLNYQYYQREEDREIPWVHGRDLMNIHAKIGLTYFVR